MYIVCVYTWYSCARSFDVRKSWIIKTQLFLRFIFFFFETPFGEKTRQSPEISIKHHSGPALLPLAWCLTEKKEAGGFGAL